MCPDLYISRSGYIVLFVQFGASKCNDFVNYKLVMICANMHKLEVDSLPCETSL